MALIKFIEGNLLKTDRMAGGTQGGWREKSEVERRQAGQREDSKEKGWHKGGQRVAWERQNKEDVHSNG